MFGHTEKQDGETSSGVEGLPNLTMARPTALESVAFTAPTKRGKVDFTARALSAIVYLAHHSGPNMAARRRLREINKSSERGGFCMCVCLSL